MTLRRPVRPAVAAVLALVVVGCGLKGPLTMPEPSTNIVIRGPDGKPIEPAAPAAPTAPAPSKPAPADETLPPPPLPGRHPGAHGG